MVDGIHESNVTRWFTENIPGVSPPLSFEVIPGGHSNLTYKVEDGNRERYVLRRPPLGQVLKSAHDMGREHTIISSLQKTEVPVPPALGICRDLSVNGSDFYVMGYVEGRVLADSTDAAAIPEGDRGPLGLDVIDVLARLHGIDPDAVGLGGLGKKEDYVARQVKRWARQWEMLKTEEIPEMDEVGRLLKERIPRQLGAAIAHGDYRIGNMILRENRVAAVLDWELCTLGDPLADVGYLLNWWQTAEEVTPGKGDDAPTAAGGFPTREELISYYENATGRSLERIHYYRALACWRLAVIYQGVSRRYAGGAMGDSHHFSFSSASRFIRGLGEKSLILMKKDS